MGTLTDREKDGLRDFFAHLADDDSILFQVAKSLTKNFLVINNSEEAFDVIFLHTTSASVLLNKRAITKEILFKYLHKNRVLVSADVTKAALVSKVLDLWNSRDDATSASCAPSSKTARIDNVCSHTDSANADQESRYPIHLMARQFSEWFFENYNGNSLIPSDFWSNARLDLRIAATDCVNDQQALDSKSVVETLAGVRDRFQFYFNANLTHDGAQGRMDIHGLVLVLTCGTLHTLDRCVGVFESVFGLMRDPFAENNWKVKTLKVLLRSEGAPSQPKLHHSDLMRDTLCLPAPSGSIG